MENQTNEQKDSALNPCEKCNAPADGLDDIHCQEHWEQVCSDAWYEQIYEKTNEVTF